MMSSGMFDSKMTGLYTTTDTHEFFTNIYDKLCDLEDRRIVERIARPIGKEAKVKIMDDVNRTLQQIRSIMDEIYECSSLLKGKEDGMVREMFVTTHAWKSGVRKIQAKITNFYEVKMKYFEMINSC